MVAEKAGATVKTGTTEKTGQKTSKNDSEYLLTFARGLSVLRAFDSDRPEMTLSEVAAVTGLNAAVVRRCLNTLLELGYVAKNGRLFLLTPEVLGFSSAYLNSMNLETIVQPYLQDVSDKTGDSTSMAVLWRDEVLYLQHVSTNRMIRLAAGIGTRFPAYATSLGRVLLAFQSPQSIADYFDHTELVPLTSHTTTSRSTLESILEETRAQGYASIQDELDYGIVSISVPIFAEKREILCAINCSTSTARIDKTEIIKDRLPILNEAANRIEAAIRQWPPLAHSIKMRYAPTKRDKTSS
ncbi:MULTISPECIES: IclR family transcriptional regulator C-terminal domain-containing protein [unclassified Iodidimonas]|jgi:IclR family pca regulon transcriptional regulator|uniref:IclR family transcriptional regulator domain-containing protein n=1 Tax=unclassified Iodidimonas TaxID=2626145 RepID=UPI002482A28C|nr:MULTISPECIES: IclR family transcriptional regulator C-terminal domain-containing protein [unclassified Iodidimonas]